jgi:hypothetical protein
MELLLIGAIASAGGAVYSGKQADAQGKAAERMMQYNAALQEREAKAIEQKARFDQRRQAERAQRIKGSLAAKLAASGARMDVGAPLMLMEEQAAELELENLLIGYEGQIGAQKALSQAQLDRMQGKIYAKKGRSAKTAGYIQAGTSLLTGFGSYGESKGWGSGGGLPTTKAGLFTPSGARALKRAWL